MAHAKASLRWLSLRSTACTCRDMPRLRTYRAGCGQPRNLIAAPQPVFILLDRAMAHIGGRRTNRYQVAVLQSLASGPRLKAGR